MGGYGSGGRNKTHKKEEDFKYRKIDSFAFYDFLNSDKYLCYKNEVKYPVVGDGIIYHVQTRTASIKFGCCRYPLGLSRVTNIDGKSIRLYFLCPECGKRVRYLYKKDESIICRTCAKLNYASQQRSGIEEIVHKMHDIVENKLQYSYWMNENPDAYLPDLSYIPKPRYMRWEKYNELIYKYEQLKEEYWKEELKSLSKFSKWL